MRGGVSDRRQQQRLIFRRSRSALFAATGMESCTICRFGGSPSFIAINGGPAGMGTFTVWALDANLERSELLVNGSEHYNGVMVIAVQSPVRARQVENSGVCAITHSAPTELPVLGHGCTRSVPAILLNTDLTPTTEAFAGAWPSRRMGVSRIVGLVSTPKPPEMAASCWRTLPLLSAPNAGAVLCPGWSRHPETLGQRVAGQCCDAPEEGEALFSIDKPERRVCRRRHRRLPNGL